jgi:Ca2+-binding EF-hand superfamily protein
MMSKDEFIQTIKIGLSVIDFKFNVSYLQDKFSLIDVNQDGYISYEEYFQFLKDYFGGNSYAAKYVNRHSVLDVMNEEKEQKGAKELDIIKKYAKL